MKKKFYAVKVGKMVGVYENWEDCKEQVCGYPGAVYRGFKTLEEALSFVNSLECNRNSA